MSTESKTPRLLAAAKEFNIGKETLVEYLTNRGFEINASNPNTKLTEVMYDALQGEFAQDKLTKRRSDEIALPKHDSGKRREEAAQNNAAKTKVEAKVEAPTPSPAPVVKQEAPVVAEEKPIENKIEPIAEKKVEEPAPVIEKNPEPIIEKKVEEPIPVVVPEPIPVPEIKPEPKQQPEPVVEEAPVAKEEVHEASNNDSDTETYEAPEQAEEEIEHIEVRAPKLDGPNILGKINLDDLNQATRPKKGAPAKKSPTPAAPARDAGKKREAPKKPATTVPSTLQPVAKKPATVAPVQQPVAVAPKAVVPETPAEEVKLEHIEMKAPQLAGPKIIGRIELPVDNGNSTKSNPHEKRNRKRIPVQKKPETPRSAPGERTGGGGQGGPGGERRSPGQGGGNRPGGGPGQGGGFNRNGPGGGGDRRGPGGNRNAPATPQVPGEIDTKQIQKKIQETQARLAGGNQRGGGKGKSKYRRDKREMMAEKRAAAENSEDGNIIQVTEFISVSELANLMDVSFAEVIGKCMGLGIMVSINQRLDAEVIELVAAEFGFEASFINLEQEAEIDNVEEEDDPALMVPRAPIVTIMGHVDHGKTSLLDYVRSANVVAGEAGGITQHIGAYQVMTAGGKKITFLDTPGHEAFTAMRARGAKVADIAVIVIAADDAIMPQTREAISHAQAAQLPMIFAINKIDKEGANPEKIREQLANLNILVEEWGGKFQSQEISAKKGLNVDLLLEKIGLEAELLELKANPNRSATGSVIEASLDKGRGYVTTILVQNGTLNQGDMIVSGQHYGRIKAMLNERGQRVTTAGPSAPVQVLGLNGAPQAGEKFKMYADENEAKETATHRAQIMREQGIRARKHLTLEEIGRRLALGNFKELPIIIKGDFDGSVEALSDSLQKLSTPEVAVNVVHKAVGQITESDVLLATASDAIIIGFQVRPSSQAARLADQENIEIRSYSIIYDAIEEIKSAMEGLLAPKVEKKTIANVEVREVYKITGVGTIAGCYVLDGKIFRGSKINLIRDGIVVFTGELGSLKRFKDDVKEVNFGYECGLSVKNYHDVRVADVIEAYEEVEVKRTL